MARPRLDHVRRAQIIAAAASILSERGYANTRVADIARAAGTSPAAVLYWFSGKDALVAEALRLREQEFHDRYTVLAEEATTAAERLAVLVRAMVRHYDWGLWMELCVLALRDEAAAAERDRMDRRWRAALRAAVRDGQQSGEFVGDDPDGATFLLAGLLDGLAPLVAVRARGVTRDRVERVWFAEASRILGAPIG
ncbi:MAG: TetR/AcrR family transcriptional regulator [Ilumatobacteraceae bacterium]